MGRSASAAARADLRDELRATVEARRELGAEYDDLVIEQFLRRLDQRQSQRRWSQRRSQLADTVRLLVLLTFALPLTGIAAATVGWPGIVIVWACLLLLYYRR
ncbi:MAG TPA: hypothetical protein VHL09_13915 [Dehalococcoidia bacterium]|nr:hypothetical protein [Dehalococcoidia bacterium]